MMLGCRNGLAVKLKGDIPHLVEIHCVAHRLELASVAAIKGIKQVQDIRDILKGLYKQYHYSPKALRELKAVAEALCVKPFQPQWNPVDGPLQEGIVVPSSRPQQHSGTLSALCDGQEL